MTAAVPLRTDLRASELRRVASKSKDANQSRRLLALAAILDGRSRTEAATIGGMALSRELREGVQHREASTHSRRSSRDPPNMRRRGPEGPKRAAGNEVALNIERVVDRSMHREKALG
jgi:hypothetical protein